MSLSRSSSSLQPGLQPVQATIEWDRVYYSAKTGEVGPYLGLSVVCCWLALLMVCSMCGLPEASAVAPVPNGVLKALPVLTSQTVGGSVFLTAA